MLAEFSRIIQHACVLCQHCFFFWCRTSKLFLTFLLRLVCDAKQARRLTTFSQWMTPRVMVETSFGIIYFALSLVNPSIQTSLMIHAHLLENQKQLCSKVWKYDPRFISRSVIVYKQQQTSNSSVLMVKRIRRKFKAKCVRPLAEDYE